VAYKWFSVSYYFLKTNFFIHVSGVLNFYFLHQNWGTVRIMKFLNEQKRKRRIRNVLFVCISSSCRSNDRVWRRAKARLENKTHTLLHFLVISFLFLLSLKKLKEPKTLVALNIEYLNSKWLILINDAKVVALDKFNWGCNWLASMCACFHKRPWHSRMYFVNKFNERS